MTQPALSRSVQTLEHELGARLFDRLGRTVLPTALGEEVLRRARRIVDEVAELQQCASALRGHEAGSLGGLLARPDVITFLLRAAFIGFGLGCQVGLLC